MNIEALNLREVTFEDSKEIEGGVHPGVAVLAACGVGLGIILVGSVVGYGLYKAIDWATR